MNYTVFMYFGPADFAMRKAENNQAYWASWGQYAKELKEAGIIRGAASLELPQNATTLKMVEGQRLVQDGPFADTKEQLGGFFIIEVPDLDSALDWAARAPLSKEGTVEVRPNLPLNN
jgi:hypothetical protein